MSVGQGMSGSATAAKAAPKPCEIQNAIMVMFVQLSIDKAGATAQWMSDIYSKATISPGTINTSVVTIEEMFDVIHGVNPLERNPNVKL